MANPYGVPINAARKRCPCCQVHRPLDGWRKVNGKLCCAQCVRTYAQEFSPGGAYPPTGRNASRPGTLPGESASAGGGESGAAPDVGRPRSE